MNILTTEAQRHRESESERDPRTAAIIGAAIEVHRTLGPGLLESAYEECLCHELHLRGLWFERQVDLPVNYKAQLLTYLKLSGRHVGLLINFKTPVLTRGIKRIVL